MYSDAYILGFCGVIGGFLEALLYRARSLRNTWVEIKSPFRERICPAIFNPFFFREQNACEYKNILQLCSIKSASRWAEMAQNNQVHSQTPGAIPETAFQNSVNEQGLDLEKAGEEENSNPISELACVRIILGMF